MRSARGVCAMIVLAATAACSSGAASSASSASSASAAARPPNIVVIFTDDQGYGDLGSYGHPTLRTPHLDRMAAEGQRWTSFYVADSVCTPSRAGLLTGRLPVRTGMTSDHLEGRRVLFPDSAGGLPAGEITIAELLKGRGYATAAVGKWHLGHLPQHLPMTQGFDSYYGIPYSNDMDGRRDGLSNAEWRRRVMDPRIEYWHVPLMRNAEVIERPADQHTVTRRYTDEAIAFVRANTERPFFLYLAHSMPHVPLFTTPELAGKSRRGLYGDVIEELDVETGRLLDVLRELRLDRHTLVVFTSDNGPWALYDEQGGSAGPLRGAKGGTFEGGMRVPALFWWPGTIRPGVVTDMGSTLDLLPTVAALAGLPVPSDRVLDGYDLTPVLRPRGDTGGSGGTGRQADVGGASPASPRQTMFFYRGSTVYAVRHGAFKAHLITRPEYDGGPTAHDPWLLYNLDHDPSEKYDVAGAHPEVLAELRRIVDAHLATVEPVPTQMDARTE
jgi:arylsulfatase A